MHKLFLNFRRILNLRSLTRTWFLEKLDSSYCQNFRDIEELSELINVMGLGSLKSSSPKAIRI